MLLSYSHLFLKNLGSWHSLFQCKIHTGFCVGGGEGGEVWEVVVEADMCCREVVRMVD